MAEPPVVSNTTPLIVLAGVGHLELLTRLYGRVLIPEQVRDEYEVRRRVHEPPLAEQAWFDVTVVEIAPDLAQMLDAGEAAAISLARQASARVLLLDERRGRRVALQEGLPVVGSLGVLIRAKRAGLLPLLTPVLDQLQLQGRHMSEQLRAEALRLAGELDT